jgi:hypothetical protein
MTNLSPAAFAVWDAAWDCPIGDCSIKQGRRRQIAAAIRAAADQVLAVTWEGAIPPSTTHMLGINWTRDALHVIANELEGNQ